MRRRTGPQGAALRNFAGVIPVDHEFDLKEELILRDHLALVRTRLANERTLLSYTRSTLYLLLGGLALLQMDGPARWHWIGIAALSLSGFFIFFGTYRYVTLRRQLNRFYPPRPVLGRD